VTAEVGRRTGSAAEHDETPSFDELYHRTWWPMLCVAYALIDDVAAAEDVVQDAFAALHRRWDALSEPAAAAGYLRVSVVNGARSVLRKRLIVRRRQHLLDDVPTESADASTLLMADHQLVRAALARLPDRQREVLTLRYVAELSDLEIAKATGLSHGGVRSAASRGLAALRNELGGRV
jgi:RNA polymerase sigma-70 factor (sigma-E family)